MCPEFDPVRTELASEAEHGALTLEGPDRVQAGAFASWRLVYQAGERPVCAGGSLTIFTECDSDWAKPQVTDPAGDDYLTVEPPPGVTLIASVPDHKTIVLTVGSGSIEKGGQIAVNLGDQRSGGRGSRSQTFYEDKRYFLCDVDHDGSGKSHVLETKPIVHIVGGDLARLSVIAPPDVDAGQPFSVWLKAEDAWGNPAQSYRGEVSLTAQGITLSTGTVTFDEESTGVVEVPGCRVSEPGMLRITAADRQRDISGVSNPVNAVESLPELKLFWGDPHSGQVADARKIGDYFRHARDVAKLHFASFQRNDSAHSTAAYRIQQQEEESFHEPGEFVPLPGFEWSGNLPAGGHHNVYFRRFNQPMKRWRGASRLGEKGETDLPHVRDLHNYYRNTDTVITPHVGGQHADLQWHDPELEPALEVVSTHGTFEWFLRESIQRGYRMGFVGGNDCHTGRPGDDRPGHQLRRYAKGGLTGIYAPDLSLASVLDAIRKRRCYATTGARIRAAHSVSGHFMGEEFTTGEAPEISVQVAGAGPLERVDVFRGLTRLHEEQVFPARSNSRLRITWSGASRMSSYSGVVWDGRVDVKGSGIKGVETLRFDSPRSRWDSPASGVVRFHSWMCGYTSGLVIDLEDPDAAEIKVSFDSSLINGEQFGLHGEVGPRRMALAQADSGTVTVRMHDLDDGPVSVDLGHLDRRVTVERCPEPGAVDTSFTITDPDPKPGFNPYWVRVTQLDQEVAWLSPVFVDFVAS